jgi:putative sterol carrier protein
MAEVTSVNEAMSRMDERFNPAKAEGVNGTIQLELTGDQPGTWTINIHDGTYEVIEGGVSSPTTTLIMSTEDYLGMVNGTVNAMAAFMQGRIKLQGDMGLAMRFQSIFGIA